MVGIIRRYHNYIDTSSVHRRFKTNGLTLRPVWWSNHIQLSCPEAHPPPVYFSEMPFPIPLVRPVAGTWEVGGATGVASLISPPPLRLPMDIFSRLEIKADGRSAYCLCILIDSDPTVPTGNNDCYTLYLSLCEPPSTDVTQQWNSLMRSSLS